MVVPVTLSHLVGTKWTRFGRGDITPTTPPPVTTVTSRFPGDTNPKATGKVLWGLDEFDQDPTSVHVSEVSAPEVSAGMPCSMMRSYFSGATTALLPPNGAAIQKINEMHSKGRIPWISHMMNAWAQQADGRNNATYDSMIGWIEESAKGPVVVSLIHEPENQAKAGVVGDELDWFNVQRNFRARMTAYAAARGGDAYKWKNLSFASCVTAYAYAQAGNPGGIDRFIPAPNEKVFDFHGVDYYVGGQQGAIGSPAWGANIVKAVAWCKKYGMPMAIAEWGVNRRDPEAAAKMQEIWNRTFDGTNDIFAWLYYNSSVGSTNATEQRWLLDNVGNGGLLTKWVNLMKDPRSVHFWDLKNPATGVNYARPAGV